LDVEIARQEVLLKRNLASRTSTRPSWIMILQFDDRDEKEKKDVGSRR